MRNAVLNVPCLKRYNHQFFFVLCTDFSANGFFVTWPYSSAMTTHPSPPCTLICMAVILLFMTKDSTTVLHPVTFCCRRTRGNKQRCHSHLGECFSGDWAINKCRHMCFGQRFTWTTDCHTVKSILSYDGRNPAILCLQMRFMCWDMDIEHHNDIHLANVG